MRPPDLGPSKTHEPCTRRVRPCQPRIFLDHAPRRRARAHVLAQVGVLGWRPMLAALPITMHIEAILHANNARDVEEDLASGVRTIAARLGTRGAFELYRVLVLAPFIAPLYGALRHSLVAALPLLALPKARALVADFRDGRMVDLPKRTAKFQFLFGVLLTVGVLVPAPSLAGVCAWLARAVRG